MYVSHTKPVSPQPTTWPSPPCPKINCDSGGRANPSISFSRYLKGNLILIFKTIDHEKLWFGHASFIGHLLCNVLRLLVASQYSFYPCSDIQNRTSIYLGEIRHLMKRLPFTASHAAQWVHMTKFWQWETRICVLRKLSKERLLKGS